MSRFTSFLDQEKKKLNKIVKYKQLTWFTWCLYKRLTKRPALCILRVIFKHKPVSDFRCLFSLNFLLRLLLILRFRIHSELLITCYRRPPHRWFSFLSSEGKIEDCLLAKCSDKWLWAAFVLILRLHINFSGLVLCALQQTPYWAKSRFFIWAMTLRAFMWLVVLICNSDNIVHVFNTILVVRISSCFILNKICSTLLHGYFFNFL